jgi:pimeloyl-ACP methyl ester carboxylesterase
MQHGLLSYRNSTISYYRFGDGPGCVICFHGYGEEGQLYRFFEKYAGNQFTFYAIDLPFHGQTVWRDGLDFNHKDLQHIIDNIRGDIKEKFILMGFSLGGRIALSLYQAQPENTAKLILLAPDGLKVNFWYWLATQTWAGNKLFGFSMKYPGWFFAFLKLVNKTGLVNASIFKFVNYYIGNKEARQLLYQRWTGLRKLKPNLHRIKNHIRQYETPTRLVYGKYDRIILPSRGEKFQEGIERFCTITMIDSGHQVVHENHIEGLLPVLLD